MKSKRRLILKIKSVGLLSLVALAMWVAVRWNVWFSNPPEEPVPPLMTPAHVLLTFGNSDGMSRNVSWQCDTVLRPSHLKLVCLEDSDTTRIDAQGEVFQSRKGKAAYYVARLRQLKPSMHYRYRAVSGDGQSPWFSFTTHPLRPKRFSFMFVGDVQDTVGGIAKHIGDRYGVDNRKAASILDTFSCMMQGVIPYGAQLLMAAGLAGLNPVAIIPYLYYPLAIGIAALFSILFRYPKRYS